MGTWLPWQRNRPFLDSHGVVSAAGVLVVSNMVGTGIFTTTGFLAGDLGSPSLVLVDLAGGAPLRLFWVRSAIPVPRH